MLKSKVFEDGDRWDEGVTIVELALWARDNGVPVDARVMYAGCGSHQIMFVWSPTGKELEEMIAQKLWENKEAEIIAQRQRDEGLIA